MHTTSSTGQEGRTHAFASSQLPHSCRESKSRRCKFSRSNHGQSYAGACVLSPHSTTHSCTSQRRVEAVWKQYGTNLDSALASPGALLGRRGQRTVTFFSSVRGLDMVQTPTHGHAAPCLHLIATSRCYASQSTGPNPGCPQRSRSTDHEDWALHQFHRSGPSLRVHKLPPNHAQATVTLEPNKHSLSPDARACVSICHCCPFISLPDYRVFAPRQLMRERQTLLNVTQSLQRVLADVELGSVTRPAPVLWFSYLWVEFWVPRTRS